MRVFVTGATGWVGSHVVAELIGAGHSVTGLVRSPDKAAALAAQGADVLAGTLNDLNVLTGAAQISDAVLHLAFNHDFSKFADNAQQDRVAIETLGAALAGTDKPLIATSGLAHLAPGRAAVESDRLPADSAFPRRSEAATLGLRDQGLRASVVRLAPSVHGVGDHGFMAILAAKARETGVSAYVGEGLNRWCGVHVTDAARVYRLALEEGLSLGAYHAADEEGVAFRDIAAVIGKQLGLPVESRGPEHFGWFGGFASADMSASSAVTRQTLDWTPAGPGFLKDLDQAAYWAG